MIRCQFLCFVLKTLVFIKIALKLSYFCKKMKNFQALGAPPPDPKIRPPIAKFWLRAWFHFLVKTFFFALHLICSPEKKNRGRGSSPPMLKIGQNWGKIANYPPPMLSKDLHPCLLTPYQTRQRSQLKSSVRKAYYSKS